MQGFNRYIPPDYDPKKNSTLNSFQGKKHALGNRAKDIDKGVLVVRFELPFNIWCESCGNHIGAGVRYNAQKKKVGNYYSTPIYAFKCKCHLCSGWFEIRTDPQNAAYIVESGAKKQNDEWDPEENGGYAVRDSEAPPASGPPDDPIAHLEKTIDQAQWAKKNTSRITELSEHSSRLNADPYAVSLSLRRRFREEKKVLLEKQGRDMDLKEKYGLHDDVDLGAEDVDLGREMWEAGRERAGLGVEPIEDAESSVAAVRGTPTPSIRSIVSLRKGKGVATDGGSPNLAQTLRKSTARKYDPFDEVTDAFFGSAAAAMGKSKVRLKGKDPDTGPERRSSKDKVEVSHTMGLAGGLLAGYGSD